MSGKTIDHEDKHGEEIHKGDVVGTRYRGGTREGTGTTQCRITVAYTERFAHYTCLLLCAQPMKYCMHIQY